MNETKTMTKPTSIQENFIEMDRRFSSEIKPFLDAFKVAKEAVIIEVGNDVFFQDDEGTVYKTAEKKGQWVDFHPYEIQRTRREGEAKGTLSMSAAKEAGFDIETAKGATK